MADNDYVRMLRESLEKKERILVQIEQKNIDQQNILLDPNADPDEFDETIEAKARLVDEIVKLDEGFETLYNEVGAILESNKAAYADEIKKMKTLISSITDHSSHIQAQEKRNYELAKNKFATVRKQVQKVRTSQRAVNKYYQTMMKTDYEPQFFEDKK